jgi:DNA-binding transcriptional MerR regulator
MEGERNLIPIGQFSLLTRLTVRALRLYDRLGILVPAHVDPDSGYRYYAPEQAKLGSQIGRLRAIDLPLDEVRSVLETPVQLTRSLELHASTLRNRRDEAERALDLLRSIQKGIEPLNVPIEIRDVQPTRGISIEMRTSMDAIGPRSARRCRASSPSSRHTGRRAATTSPPTPTRSSTRRTWRWSSASPPTRTSRRSRTGSPSASSAVAVPSSPR